MTYKQNARDEQAPQTGKVVNDHNKVGEQAVSKRPANTPCLLND